MAITTSNSTRVKALWLRRLGFISLVSESSFKFSVKSVALATDWNCSNGYGLCQVYNLGKVHEEDSVKNETKTRTGPFARTRNDHANETAEDYVEAVAEIIARAGECRVVDLSRHFSVSHVTVSRIVKRLQNEQLLQSEPYRPIELTPKGSKLAKRVLERHKIVLEFLIAIGVDKRSAEIDSEGIEHHVGPKTLAAMKRFLEN